MSLTSNKIDYELDDVLEKCMMCKHVYRRKDDADTLYCRCRKGCRYEPHEPNDQTNK